MIKFIIIIPVVVLLIIGLVLFINRRFISTHKVKVIFNQLSICVCGDRGSGKDTLFSYISRKIPHNSNTPLHSHTNLIALDDLMIPELRRKLLVEGARFNIDYEKYKQFENVTFISDAGIHFPSYEDSALKKEYSNLAISIAIWRHLYDSPLHFNCQKSSRLWLILREQLNNIIECKGVRFGLFYCKLYLTFYENIKDYEDGKSELKKPLLMKEDSTLLVEKSTRGIVKDYVLLFPKKYIEHDPRYFKKIVFKEV